MRTGLVPEVAHMLYADRYTVGADIDRSIGRNDNIADEQRRKNSSPERAARVRELARLFPSMSEGALRALADQQVSVPNAAGIAALDAESKAAESDRYGLESGNYPSDKNPSKVKTDFANTVEAISNWNLPGKVVDKVAENPITDWFQSTILEPGLKSTSTPIGKALLFPANTLTQSAKLPISTGLAAMWTGWSFTYDALYRRSAGVRQEIDWYADQYEMNPAEKKRFAQMVDQVDQVNSGFDFNLSEDGTVNEGEARWTPFDWFMADNPLAAEVDPNMPVDEEKLAKAFSVMYDPDPNVGYGGADSGGFWKRNWYSTPLGQLATHGGWGESWVGLPEENRERIEKFHAVEFDIRSVEERKADQRKQQQLLRDAQELNFVAQLDPDLMFAAYGPRGGTMGRHVAEVNLRLDPQTAPYDLISGSIDAGTLLLLDPVNYIPMSWYKTGFQGVARGASKATLAGMRKAGMSTANKTPLFEASRMMRASAAKPKYVERPGNITETGESVKHGIVWDEVEPGTYAPSYPQSTITFDNAPRIRHVRQWSSDLDGGVHLIIADPETGKYGYQGPLNITSPYDSRSALQNEIFKQSRDQPVYTDVTQPPSAPQGQFGDVWVGPQGPMRWGVDAKTWLPARKPSTTVRRQGRSTSRDLERYTGEAMQIRKDRSRYRLYDSAGNEVTQMSGKRTITEIVQALDDEFDNAVANALPSKTHPPLFTFKGGEISEVKSAQSPTGKQWVVRPHDPNGKVIRGQEQFFPTRAEAEDFVRTGIWNKQRPFTNSDTFVVTDKDGNWMQGYKSREEANDRVMKEIGYDGIPQSYITIEQADNFYRYTPMGRKVVEFLTNTTSPGTIRGLMNGKIDFQTAVLLAKAETTDDVLSIIGKRTGNVITDPKGIARIGRNHGIHSTITEGYWRAQSKSRLFRNITRLGHMSPRAGSLHLNDVDEVVEAIERFGVGLGTPYLGRDGQKGIIDWIDDFAADMDSLGGRYSFFNNEKDGFFDAVVGGAMERAGVPTDVTRRLSRAKQKPKKSKRRAYKGQVLPQGRLGTPTDKDLQVFAPDYDFNRITDSRMGEGTWYVGANSDIPIFMDEAMREFIPIPDYKAVRRQINLLGKLFRGIDEKGVQKIVKAMTKKVDVGGIRPAMGIYDFIGEVARSLTTFWRNFTLMSTPYFIRNIAEEQFRMGLAGDRNAFTNPLGALSTSIMIASSRSFATRTSKALTNIALLGMPMLIRKIRRDRLDASDIHMVKTEVLLDPTLKIRVPPQSAQATVRGRKTSQDALARSVARSGVEEPIVVAYDPAAQRWRVKDGHKRLHVWRTMPDALRPTHIPVRIVEEKIPYRKGKHGKRRYMKWSNKVPVRATTKLVATPHRPKPLLAVDDTRNKAIPAHVFGKGSSAGTLDKLLTQAGDDMEALGGLSASLTYAVPYFNRRYATIVGDDWNKGYNAAIEGGWDEVSDPMTMAASNAAGGHHLVDEPSQRARASGMEAFARDSEDTFEDYVWNLALRHKQLSDLPHVKQLFARYPLEEDMNIYIREWMERNPEALQQLRSIMVANEPPQSLRDIQQKIRRPFTNEDMDTLRNVLGAQLESAYLWGGRGADTTISEAIHTGVYKGRKIGTDNEEYLNLLRAVLRTDSKRRMFPEEITGLPRRGPVTDVVRDKMNGFVEWFFNTAAEGRDIMTASPLMREAYTDAVIQLVPHMGAAARRQVVKNLLRAGDAKLAGKVERASRQAGRRQEGWLTVEFAHHIAARRAATKLRHTFYDAMERRNWATAMRVAMPFAQAQVNTLAKWGEFMLKNPQSSYRAVRSIDSFRSMFDITMEDIVADRWGGYKDREPPPVNVFLASAEQQDARYIMPAYGQLAKLLGLGDATATGTFESANLAAGGAMPGTGPVITLGAGVFLKDLLYKPTWDGDVARAIWRYPLPEGSLADKMLGTVLPSKWADGVAVAMDERNPEFVKKQLQVYAQVMDEKYAGVSWKNVEELNAATADAMEIAKGRAQKLLWLETFTKVFLPAAGALTYEPSVIKRGDNGTVEFIANREAAAMWQKYTQGAEGQQYGEQVRAFQQDFGKYANLPFVSITDNREAPPLTTEMQQIAYERPKTYETWHELWGYVMPQGDPFKDVFNTPSLAKFREQQQKKGYRKSLTAQEVVKLQSDYMWQAVLMQRLDELKQTAPWDTGRAQRIRDEISTTGYRQYLTIEDARGTINEIEQMMQDEDAVEVVPGAPQIKAFLKRRREIVDQFQSQWGDGNETRSSDLSSSSSFYAVAELDRLATELIRQDDSGSFNRFYETLARVEFGDNADRVEEFN